MANDVELIKEVLEKIEQAIAHLRAADISVPPALDKVVVILQDRLGMRREELPAARGPGQS